MDYRVLLYYKYTTIEDPETFATEHLDFCKDLELKGRILVSTEGINGTVIDARNDYEYDLGHFRGAIRPNITRFRDLPDWIKENKDQFMDKKIVTYCTGGIRCEKFSGYLLREGFEDVSQLEGGIATYGKDPETKGEYWDGKMYVFDERISVDVNQVEKTVVGKEWFDGTPCERYINCSNPECNRQILVSEENEARYLGACCHECAEHENNRYVKKHGISDEEKAKRLENFKQLV